ncbi:MAG TPA: class III signal peptide-containing protein [Aquificae bacterium]|nr:class III signal peptide-containing protein [Aquificota bacterium]
MKKGQSSLGYIFLVVVAIIIVAVVIRYIELAAKGVPITGIAYIDPELSPEKPGYDHPVTWIIYRYPEGCKAKKNCDFYVSVNLHYKSNKYKVWVYANGNPDRIREVKVRLCTGDEAIWKFPEDKGHNKIAGKEIPESEFPCALYIMAWMR